LTQVAWTGNITVKVDGKEDTYSPLGSLEVEKYSEVGFALKIAAGEGRCNVVIRMTRKDCKELIKKFLDVV